jgi:uncharacterized repeat protein (TIGR03803 family)
MSINIVQPLVGCGRRVVAAWCVGCLVCVSSAFLTTAARSELTKLHDFKSATDGEASVNNIAMQGSRLFGTSWAGGTTNGGTIWRFDTSNNQFANLHNFTDANGAGPISGLTLSNSKLFGTTYLGGLHSGGSIWSFDLAGNSFSKLHDFTLSDGTFSNGGVVVSANTLYGTTRLGGQFGRGSIWKINTGGGGFTKLHNFAESGSVGGLVVAGNQLYGTTYTDGPSHDGSVWSLNLDTLAFKTLHTFDGFSKGSTPLGNIVLNGTKIVGTTYDGGAHHAGTIWSVDAVSQEYALLHSFTSSEGISSRMAPMIVDGKIFGGGWEGGVNNDGTLWSMDLSTQSFSVLANFDTATSGDAPNGGITVQNGFIYGTTKQGGANGSGTIWRSPIPEPSTLALFAIGCSAVGCRRRG